MAMDTLAVVRESGSGKEDDGGSPPVFLAGVFLDFHMPNMSGVECTKRIRQVGIYVIILLLWSFTRYNSVSAYI